MKELLGHGNFLPWIKDEFGMSDRTALNFMRVAERFKSEIVSDLPPTVLYALAAPSTPDEVKDEIIDRRNFAPIEINGLGRRLEPDARPAVRDVTFGQKQNAGGL
ncbi:DUF3102 domain-containing protein (plasmid) [Methylorubrum sp. B1-46]|nr:DUF3102 domain-containing protein [Methylorubrum sp. B1-46]